MSKKPCYSPFCLKWRSDSNEGGSGYNLIGIIQWPNPENPLIDAKISHTFTQAEL